MIARQREIRFRAKTKGKNSQWITGYLEIIRYPTGASQGIIHSFSDWGLNTSRFIRLNTVGQFSGSTDSNGYEIYEGDIVDCWMQVEDEEPWRFRVAVRDIRALDSALFSSSTVKREIVGNIYDDPNL